MFNSAKNKYDSDDELEENKQMKKEGSNGKILNEENISLSRRDICETGVTSMMNSRDNKTSDNSYDLYGFLGPRNKPDLRKVYNCEEQNDELSLELKYILCKLIAQNTVNDLYNNKFSINNFFYDYFICVNNRSNFISTSDSQNDIKNIYSEENSYISSSE